MYCIPSPRCLWHHLAPSDRGLAAEGIDADTAGTGALLGVIRRASALRSRLKVATAVADLSLGCGGGKARCSEAGEEEGVNVELHLDDVVGLRGIDAQEGLYGV